MNETTKALAKKNGGQQTSKQLLSDPLRDCIVSLINAMRIDFDSKFKVKFGKEKQINDEVINDDKPKNNVLRMYKRRLYAKLRGQEIEDIVDGYELFVDTLSEWPPEVTQLIKYVEQAKKQRLNKLKNQAEAEAIAKLPPPTITCNPLKLLAEAKSHVGDEEDSHDAWMARKAKALQNYNAVLELHSGNIVKRYASGEHKCCIPSCNNAGTISSSTKGEGNVYCSRHFKQMG